MRVADGAGRDDGTGRIGATRPKFVDGDTWGTAVGAGRGARSGWVGAEQRALTSGAGAPLFGEIDTYGWDGARLIRWESYVWSGAAGGKQAAS